MGFEEFDDLYDAVMRNEAQERITTANIIYVASQGAKKNMDKLLARWYKLLDDGGNTGLSVNDLIKDVK